MNQIIEKLLPAKFAQKLKKKRQNRQKEEWKINIENHKNVISKITNENFTIFSSNCWGGTVYEDLKIPYQTPTVGLFFYAPCFITLLKDLKNIVGGKLEFIKTSKYQEANTYLEHNNFYPIGLLNNEVEIHFLHYKTEEDAREKWESRKERINWDNLFIACTDRDLMTPKLMKEYDKIDFPKKVLFTSKKYFYKTITQLKAFKGEPFVGDLYRLRYTVTINFDLAKWLNK